MKKLQIINNETKLQILPGEGTDVLPCIVDFIHASVNIPDVQDWAEKIYDNSNIHLHAPSSSTITGEHLPNSKGIDWEKYLRSVVVHGSDKLGYFDVRLHEKFQNGSSPVRELHIKGSPTVEMGNGKNDRPFSHQDLCDFIQTFCQKLCIDPKAVKINSAEISLTFKASKEILLGLEGLTQRALLFNNYEFTPMVNNTTGIVMGIESKRSKSKFKFYQVGKKWGQSKNMNLRIERKVNESFNLGKTTGLHFLSDLFDITKCKKAFDLLVDDWNSVLLTDPLLVPSSSFNEKQNGLISGGSTSDFWDHLRSTLDPKTYKSRVAEYRQLSSLHGDGLHKKISELINSAGQAFTNPQIPKIGTFCTPYIGNKEDLYINKRGQLIRSNKTELINSNQKDLINYRSRPKLTVAEARKKYEMLEQRRVRALKKEILINSKYKREKIIKSFMDRLRQTEQKLSNP